jgi:uncharacterized metal-binding protein
MPAGRTHDKITFLASIPVGATACLSQGLAIGMIVTVAFLFSGLLFNGDLDHDAEATCYDRWWIFRWLFWPYMKIMPHRSIWSHGPILGTLVRLLYVGVMAAIVTGVYAGVVQLIGLKWEVTTKLPELPVVFSWVKTNRGELIATLIGLELGSLSHTLADWTPNWVIDWLFKK